MASGPIISWQIEGGKVETVTDFIYLGSKITADSDFNHKIKRCLLLKRKAMTNLLLLLQLSCFSWVRLCATPWTAAYQAPPSMGFSRQQYWSGVLSPMTNLDSVLKSRDITLLSKGSSGQDFCFSCSHVWVWELDHKESWAPKNRCFQTVVLKKTFGSPLDCKEIKPVNPKRNQSWIFIGRTDDEAEAPVLWPPNRKNWLTGKYPDAGKGWRQEEKGATEVEMVGWHHRLNGHEF